MNRILISNAGRYRLLRTILQGIIGVLIANLDLLVAGFSFSPEVKVIIVPLVMAVLSPIMEYLGTEDLGKADVPKGYHEGRLHEIIACLADSDLAGEEKAKIADLIEGIYEENGSIQYNDILGVLMDTCDSEDVRETAEYIFQIFKGEEEAK